MGANKPIPPRSTWEIKRGTEAGSIAESATQVTNHTHQSRFFNSLFKDYSRVGVEKRKTVRFRLHVPATFRRRNQPGTKKQNMGWTRDISASGVFVISPVAMAVGTRVRLEVYLPPLAPNTSQRLRLEAIGKIIRVSKTGKDRGFAATYKYPLLREL
jgi:PilZ domain